MSDETPSQGGDRAGEARELIARVLYMIVFGFAFWACSIVLALAAVLQLLMVAFARERNENLQALGRSVAAYLREIVLYLTFVTDEPPFPFAEWPQSGSDRIAHRDSGGA